eukprot:c39986_g1_i1 orf=3-218(-)
MTKSHHYKFNGVTSKATTKTRTLACASLRHLPQLRQEQIWLIKVARDEFQIPKMETSSECIAPTVTCDRPPL